MRHFVEHPAGSTVVDRLSRRAATGAAAGLLLMTIAACHRDPKVAARDYFDAGPVFAAETPDYSHTFPIHNESTRPLKILEEIHSCTCTKVEFGSKVIPPGETGSLTMKVHLSDGFGTQTVICNVKTDHPVVPDRRYELRLTSFPKARIAPALADFGTLKLETDGAARGGPGVGDAVAATDRLKPIDAFLEVFDRASAKSPPVLGEVLTSPDVEVTLGREPTREILYGEVRRYRFPMAVRLKSAGTQEGPSRRSVAVPIVGGPTASMLVHWTIARSIGCAPSVLSFGMLSDDPSASAERTVRVFTRDGHPFRILGVKTGAPSLIASAGGDSSSLPTAPAEAHVLRFTLAPETSDARVVSGVAVIETDAPRAAELRIPWSGFLRHSRGIAQRSID